MFWPVSTKDIEIIEERVKKSGKRRVKIILNLLGLWDNPLVTEKSIAIIQKFDK